MKLPRLRFTVRGMMIAVAVAATLMACEQCRRRWVEHRDEYRSWEKTEAEMLDSADEEFSAECGFTRLSEEERERLRLASRAYTLSLAEYCHAMKLKYSRSMLTPWLPVEPDPPVPEG